MLGGKNCQSLPLPMPAAEAFSAKGRPFKCRYAPATPGCRLTIDVTPAVCRHRRQTTPHLVLYRGHTGRPLGSLFPFLGDADPLGHRSKITAGFEPLQLFGLQGRVELSLPGLGFGKPGR